MLWNVTVSGTLKSFGILYMEFMAFYETSPAQTGSIGFTFSFMMLVLGKRLKTGTRFDLNLSLHLLMLSAGWPVSSQFQIP